MNSEHKHASRDFKLGLNPNTKEFVPASSRSSAGGAAKRQEPNLIKDRESDEAFHQRLKESRDYWDLDAVPSYMKPHKKLKCASCKLNKDRKTPPQRHTVAWECTGPHSAKHSEAKQESDTLLVSHDSVTQHCVPVPDHWGQAFVASRYSASRRQCWTAWWNAQRNRQSIKADDGFIYFNEILYRLMREQYCTFKLNKRMTLHELSTQFKLY